MYHCLSVHNFTGFLNVVLFINWFGFFIAFEVILFPVFYIVLFLGRIHCVKVAVDSGEHLGHVGTSYLNHNFEQPCHPCTAKSRYNTYTLPLISPWCGYRVFTCSPQHFFITYIVFGVYLVSLVKQLYQTTMPRPLIHIVTFIHYEIT